MKSLVVRCWAESGLAGWLAWTGLATCSGAAAAQALPPFPGPVRISELARDAAGSVHGEVVATHTLPDAWACPVELKTYTREGDEVRVGSFTFTEWDDTEEAVGIESALVRALHKRSAADRALALRLLEEADPGLPAPRVDTGLRCALGEPLDAQIVPRLESHGWPDELELELVGEAGRYTDVLLRMRADPGREGFAYWHAFLVLLGRRS